MSSRYERTFNFDQSTRAKGSEVKSELSAIQAYAEAMPSPEELASGSPNAVVAAGTANALTVSAPSTWDSYTGKGSFRLTIKVTAANTGPVTLNVDGLGAIACVRTDNVALSAGDLLENVTYDFIYSEEISKFFVGVFGSILAQASAYADTAGEQATLSSDAATNSSNSADASSESATLSNNYKLYSQEWANNPEDDPVSAEAGGDGATTFSALHWAKKAAASAGSVALGSEVTGSGALVFGTTPTLSGPTFNDGYTEEVFAVTGTTPALSPTNGSIQTWTLTGASTPTAGTWASGQSMTLMIDDGTDYTIDWASVSVTWKTDGGSAPTLNTSGFTVIQLWKVDTTIYGARVGNA